VLDACVLYSAPLRDLLLSLASAGLYQARWTIAIQHEWISNLLRHRPDLQTVTFNIKDFVGVPEIEVRHPDDFLVSRFHHDETATLKAIKHLRQRLRNPCKTPQDLIATYERQGLPRFSWILQNKIHLR
jgi:hypothetical protein